MARRRSFDGQWAIIEPSFILNDPRLDSITPAERWLYITLWVLAVQGRRTVLPRSFLVPATLARLSRLDARTIPQGLAHLSHVCLIQIDKQEGITVLGVRSKHEGLGWKDVPLKVHDVLLRSIDTDTDTDTDTEEEDARARDSIFGPVLEILRGIDVPAYRSIEADEKWERDLAQVIADPAIGLDLSGLIAEAQKFRTWFESQLEVGKIRSNGKHRPRHRFVNGWLRKLREFKRNQGGPNGRPDFESPSQRILREAREAGRTVG